MSTLSDLLSTVFERRVRAWTSGAHDGRPTEEVIAELLSTGGEISGRALGHCILDRYAQMDDTEKRAFFAHLAQALNIQPDLVRETLAAYEADPGKQTYRAFLSAAEPDRQELIRRLNQVPGATGQLVRMRADLLRLMDDDPDLAALDLDLRHLFASWFNRGFLVLRPINWNSPAHVLEKIIAYEAVHEITSWDDLRRRVEPSDRRCFAFFHPAIPDEPLIFVEVALTQGVPGSVQGLLAEDREGLQAEDADTAVFYSISNCQTGLASISFGNSLIKQVVADLSAELPGLKTFVTLSPVPGFAKWAEGEALELTPDQTDITAMAATYIVNAKGPAGAPLDPVARFHLGNGAQVHKLHAGADTSGKGLRQSYGVMVNYLYNLAKLADNHERYAAQNKVTVSTEIKALAASAEKTLAKRSTDDEPAI